ncbi:MAG TPA: hypothetical protein VGV39_15350 [Mesorhizobium sp.]|uniref:hypothetical protein n=1 Tax=Mesorhizobium sp. TaxID=1871066 RepID=UPI002DDD5F0B|nr:hypothetical protein [Mesorhizobium sp.]HEV2504452.1 hypothetical protein [Mesorhizobium sp.]
MPDVDLLIKTGMEEWPVIFIKLLLRFSGSFCRQFIHVKHCSSGTVVSWAYVYDDGRVVNGPTPPAGAAEVAAQSFSTLIEMKILMSRPWRQLAIGPGHGSAGMEMASVIKPRGPAQLTDT